MQMHNPCKITADIYCKSDTSGFPPSYRLYINDTLLTERTFTWDSKIFIRENIFANLPKGAHTIKVENCKVPGEFIVKNVVVDGKVVDNTTFVI